MEEIEAFKAVMPRKVIAGHCGKSEATFSKMTGGSQAFGIDDFGQLPRPLQVRWMKRYGREVLGLEVRELDPSELNEELLLLVDRIVAVRRLSSVVTKTAKADLPSQQKQRRSA